MSCQSGLTSWTLVGTILFSVMVSSAAERYVISLPQSQFQFRAYSLFAKPQGTFRSFSGEIVADAHNLSASQVHFVIDAASIDTDNAKRDEHLRSEDFLFVVAYPTISFVSTMITREGPDYSVQGDLQIRGVTQRVAIPVTVTQQQDKIVVQGNMRLNRRDFGVNYNAFFNPVRDTVDVMFTIVGVKP
jgi:polyisoprenoid-binding protein YceI